MAPRNGGPAALGFALFRHASRQAAKSGVVPFSRSSAVESASSPASRKRRSAGKFSGAPTQT